MRHCFAMYMSDDNGDVLYMQIINSQPHNISMDYMFNPGKALAHSLFNELQNRHFTHKELGSIPDYWETLRGMIDNSLDNNDEVCIIGRHGNKVEVFWELFDEMWQQKPDLVVISFKDLEIKDLTFIKASPEQKGKLEKALVANKGILRLTK